MYYKSDSYILEEDIYNPSDLNKKQLKDYNDTFDDILQYIIDTEGEDELRHPFLNYVRMIETGDAINKKGIAEYPYGQYVDSYEEDSTASGVYQFNDKSLETAIARARNVGISEEFLKTLSDDPNEWDDVQSDVMFLANLFPREVPKGQNTYHKVRGGSGVVNELLEQALLEYDRKAMEDLYYTLHYTTDIGKWGNTRGVDPDTIERVNDVMVPDYRIDWGYSE